MNRELDELRAMKRRLQTACERESDPDAKRKLRQIFFGSTYGKLDRTEPMGNSKRVFSKASKELAHIQPVMCEQVEIKYSENTRCSRASSRETSDEC